jgi:hypothetical protein
LPQAPHHVSLQLILFTPDEYFAVEPVPLASVVPEERDLALPQSPQAHIQIRRISRQ